MTRFVRAAAAWAAGAVVTAAWAAGAVVTAAWAAGAVTAAGTPALDVVAPRVVPAGHVPTLAAAGHRAGPPPGHTGGFGQPSCHVCHFDHPPDTGPDTGRTGLRVDGLPDAYEPGATYSVSVSLYDPALRRAGFQLATRFAAGEDSARQAGTLRAADARVAVRPFGTPPIEYAQHTDIGTDAPPGRALWTIVWTAPARGATVNLHIAANAANDDDSEFGDRIYLRTHTLHAIK